MILTSYLEPALTGFLLGGSLIVAIGAQNAFVLRLGLQRQHVFPIALLCALSDGLLILAGVAGMGALVQRYDVVLQFITWGGFIFLFVYGLQAFIRAFKQEHMDARRGDSMSLQKAVLTVLAFTYLNPHVYLDTVVLVGGLSAQWKGIAQGAFAFGAISASFVWFFSLGYGARVLTPLFEKPMAWRVLDILIGLIMWLLAFSLILSDF